MKSAAAEREFVTSLPVTVLTPDHAPEAVQDVALVVDQFSVVELPEMTEVGVAVKVTVGTGVTTVTVTLWDALPPAPAQASA